MSSNIKINRICQSCGEVFEARTTVTKYCGKNCANRAYKARKKQSKLDLVNKETQEQLDRPIKNIQEKDFLSIKEVSQLLGISRTSIWRLAKTGRVKTAQIGRRKFFLRSSLNELFEPPISSKTLKETEPKEYNIEECFYMGEIQTLYGISEKALYEAIKRFNVPKFKNGKKVYSPKVEIIKILGEPKNNSHGS